MKKDSKPEKPKGTPLADKFAGPSNWNPGLTARQYAAIQIAAGLACGWVSSKPVDVEALSNLAVSITDKLLEKVDD